MTLRTINKIFDNISLIFLSNILLPVVYIKGSGNDSDSNSDNNYDNNSEGNPEGNPEDDSEDDSKKDSAEDTLEDRSVSEREDHNTPEALMDDLDLLDKAWTGNQAAVDEMKHRYPEFFRNQDDLKGMKEAEEYIESEFPLELELSEREADELEARHRNNSNQNVPGNPSSTSETTKRKERDDDSNDEADSKPSKRQKKSDDDDSNNNSSGGNISGSSGPSDSGPTGSSEGPSNFSSKIFIIIGGILETISQVIGDLL